MEIISRQCFICKEIIQSSDPAKLEMKVLDENDKSITISKFVCDDCEKFMEYMVEKTEGLYNE